MKLAQGFLENVRIMTHTLVEHMGNTFPNPWEMKSKGGGKQNERANVSETTELMNDLDRILTLSVKLTHQVARAHHLIGRGRYTF